MRREIMARIAAAILLSLLVFTVPAHAQDPQRAVEELAELGYDYSVDGFESAAAAGDYPAVILFLNSGIGPNAYQPGRMPPLIAAAQEGNRYIVETLLLHGADVNIPDDSGTTALYYAVELELPATVQVLLKYGADPNVRGPQGETSLMLAARQNQGEVARLLLEHGADLNALDEDGYTALAYAADYGSDQVHAILLTWYNELYPRRPVISPPKTIHIGPAPPAPPGMR